MIATTRNRQFRTPRGYILSERHVIDPCPPGPDTPRRQNGAAQPRVACRRLHRSGYGVAAGLLFGVTAALAHGDAIWHVDIDAAPGGDGTSWATAFDDLHEGLAAAEAGDAVWVAEGVYTPDVANGNRARSFVVEPGVAVYGGFRGDETSLDQRSIVNHPVVLSGDLNGDDGPQFANTADNTFNVVRAFSESNADRATQIDGVTVTAGRGGAAGAGIRIEGNGRTSLVRCELALNWSDVGAGALFARQGAINIVQCSFRVNNGGDSRTGDGGGAGIQNATSVRVIDCVFSQNRTVDRSSYAHSFGGGLYVQDCGKVVVSGCRFDNNRGFIGGGGMSVWRCADVDVTDCTFVDNRAAKYGGGADAWGCDDTSFSNCTFIGNEVSADTFDDIEGGGIHCVSGPLSVADCAFISNRADSLHPVVKRGEGGAIAAASGVVVRRCMFDGNYGRMTAGAISGDGDQVVVEDCELVGNSSGGAAAALLRGNSREGEVIVRGCTFRENGVPGEWVLYIGAYRETTLIFEDCEIRDNIATSYVVLAGTDRGVLRNLVIEDNEGTGLRMQSTDDPDRRNLVTNCLIRRNLHGGRGGGVSLAVAVADFVNCVIEGNSASFGGGVGAENDSDGTFANCTIVNNVVSSSNGGGAADGSGNAILRFVNCIITDNGEDPLINPTSVDYCLVDGGSPGMNNLPGPAVFRDPINGDYRLQPGAPGIDAGNADALPSDITVDLDGNPRFHDDIGLDDTGVGDPTYLDLGAYEFQGETQTFRLTFQPEIPVAGRSLLVGVYGSEPYTDTYLVSTLVNTGQTPVPQLNVVLGLTEPVLAGAKSQTRFDGRTSWRLNIPANLVGETIWYQAIQRSNPSVVRGAVIASP